MASNMAADNSTRGTEMASMDSKSSPVYSMCLLYHTDAAVKSLDGLSFVQSDQHNDGPITAFHDADPATVLNDSEVAHKVSEKMTCVTCMVDFVDREDQTDHYRSDWHRHNLKRRLQSRPPVAEHEFDATLGDVSSISGSDSSGEDANDDGIRDNRSNRDETQNAHRGKFLPDGSQPKIYFRNSEGNVLSIYKTLLYNKKSPIENPDDIISAAQALPNRMKWALFLGGGGHFAAAIFDKDEMLCHKTFHRYVVRAKRGSTQSSRDGQGTAPKSAGATLRRYNEAALSQEIQDLIASWMGELRSCDMVFIRSANQHAFRQYFLAGKDAAFTKTDARFRKIPFATKRPTLNEVKRARLTLASIELYGNECDFNNALPRSPPRRFNKDANALEIKHVENQDCPRMSKSSGGKARTRKGAMKASRSTGMETNVELDCADPDIEDDSAEEDVSLEFVDVEVSFEHLRMFDSSVDQQRRGRRSKVKQALPPTMAEDPPSEDDARRHLLNCLYTACKTGNSKALHRLLLPLTSESSPIPAKVNPATDFVKEDDVENEIQTSSSFIECIQELSKATSELLGEVNESMSPSRTSNCNVYQVHSGQELVSEGCTERVCDGNIENVSFGVTGCVSEVDEDLKEFNAAARNLDLDADVITDVSKLVSDLTVGSGGIKSTDHSNSGLDCLEIFTDNGGAEELIENDSLLNAANLAEANGSLQGVNLYSDRYLGKGEDAEGSYGNVQSNDSQLDDVDNDASVSVSVCDTHDTCAIDAVFDGQYSRSNVTEMPSLYIESSPKHLHDSLTSIAKNTVGNIALENNKHKNTYENGRECVQMSVNNVSDNGQTNAAMLLSCLNEPIGFDGHTVLHVAAKHNHKSLIPALLAAGADPTIRNREGAVPFNMNICKNTKNEFRLFREKHPGMYDYEAAQITLPATQAELKQVKEQTTQKRRLQKRRKQERTKLKNMVEKKICEEEEEKKRFLGLSDREKRALAAEKRFLIQSSASNLPQPVLNRCFQCADDITGKVPFEYNDYKFCTTKCLRQHRLGNK